MAHSVLPFRGSRVFMHRYEHASLIDNQVANGSVE